LQHTLVLLIHYLSKHFSIVSKFQYEICDTFLQVIYINQVVEEVLVYGQSGDFQQFAEISRIESCSTAYQPGECEKVRRSGPDWAAVGLASLLPNNRALKQMYHV